MGGPQHDHSHCVEANKKKTNKWAKIHKETINYMNLLGGQQYFVINNL